MNNDVPYNPCESFRGPFVLLHTYFQIYDAFAVNLSGYSVLSICSG